MTPRCIPTAFLQYFVNPSWHVDADADDDDDDGGELKASGLRLSFRAYEDIYIYIYIYVPGSRVPGPPPVRG